MRIEHGYAVIKDRLSGKVTQELSVFACAHCHRKIHTTTLRSHEFSTCRNCEDGKGRGLICDSPKCQERCTPFFRALEIAESRAQFRSML